MIIWTTALENRNPSLDTMKLSYWKVNEKLDTELREFNNYIFQSLWETCNQELNASFLYCNRSQYI